MIEIDKDVSGYLVEEAVLITGTCHFSIASSKSRRLTSNFSSMRIVCLVSFVLKKAPGRSSRR